MIFVSWTFRGKISLISVRNVYCIREVKWNFQNFQVEVISKIPSISRGIIFLWRKLCFFLVLFFQVFFCGIKEGQVRENVITYYSLARMMAG